MRRRSQPKESATVEGGAIVPAPWEAPASFDNGLAVLARLAERRPDAVRRHLDALFRDRFAGLVAPALRVVLENGPAIADALTERIAVEADPAVIGKALAGVPNGTLSLAPFAYAAARRLVSLSNGAEPADDEDAWLEHAALLTFLAHSARAVGRAEEALAEVDKAVAFCERMGDRFPGQHRAALANAWYVQAALLSDLRRPQEAVRICGQAIDLLRPLAEEFPGQFTPQLCDLLSDQAGYLQESDHPQQALALIDEALGRRLAARPGGDGRPDADLANACARKAEILESMGRQEDAIVAAKEAASIFHRLFHAGGTHGDTSLVDLLASRVYCAKLLLDLERNHKVLQVTLGLLYDMRASWDRLAAAPANPDLAALYFDVCQLGLAIRLPEHALPFARLAVEEYGTLHEHDPQRYADDLAEALELLARADASCRARGTDD